MNPVTPAEAEFETADTSKLVESLEREGAERIRLDEDKPIEQSDNSLVRLINNMIVEAWSQGVSDIHVESYPGRDKVKIRFRKDGVLQPYLELPHNYRSALIARIKIMCDLDISERRKPQDGKINFAKFSPSHRVELRVATIPTNSGLEDVVMRLLASAKPIPIDQLGLSPRNLATLMQASERPYGLILCVGPTGSGKTTTLHSVLSHINVPERKIWTAEDPIEITQPGLRQVQVNPKIEWTFAKALRAFLRADPDVIMVGEMRDQETAQTAIEASLTGHLVLSTLHTNSAPDTVTRLLDMGMDPFNFGDSLLVVLAQRLVRRLCPHCRETRLASPAEVEELTSDYMNSFPPGCDAIDRDSLQREWMRALRPPRQAGAAREPRLRRMRPDRPRRPRRGARDDADLARAAPPGADRRAQRGGVARRHGRRHAHPAPGRHREGARRRDDDRGSAGDEQRLTPCRPAPAGGAFSAARASAASSRAWLGQDPPRCSSARHGQSASSTRRPGAFAAGPKMLLRKWTSAAICVSNTGPRKEYDMSTPLARARRRPDELDRPIASALLLDEAHQDLIAQSHQRCASIGLSRIEAPDYSRARPRRDLAETLARNRRLYTHAAPVMEMLYEQIVNTQSMVVLTDSCGTIIHSIGDDDFLAKAVEGRAAAGRQLVRVEQGHERHGHGADRTRRRPWCMAKSTSCTRTTSSPARPRRSSIRAATSSACST